MKHIAIRIANRIEIGSVVKENSKTVAAKFPNIPGHPTLTIKKKRIKRILFGDKIDGVKEKIS